MPLVVARSDLSAEAQRAKAEATKQSSFLLLGAKAGLLRVARNDGLKTVLAA